MKSEWIENLADGLLCAGITAGLASAVCAGFVLDGLWLNQAAVMLLLSVVLQALLLRISRSGRMVGWAAAGGAVLLAAGIAAARRMHVLEREQMTRTLIFLVIELAAALMVFLLSRTRVGIVILFLGGNLICAGSHFLQFPAPAWGFFLFLAAAVILFPFRSYLVLRRTADLEMKSSKTWDYLRQILCISLAALLLAVGGYWGIIRPLHPPTQELKLITLLKSMDTLERLGVSSTQSVLDPDLLSEQQPEQTELASAPEEQENPDLREPEADSPEEDVPAQDPLDIQQLSAVWYGIEPVDICWGLVLAFLLLAGALGLRLLLKRRWRRRVRGMSRESAVLCYYRFFLSRMSRIGLKKPDAQTLREYAADRRFQLQAFDGPESTFEDLTESYEKVLYGQSAVTEQEYQRFERYYDSFYRNLRREIGPVKYYLQLFRF